MGGFNDRVASGGGGSGPTGGTTLVDAYNNAAGDDFYNEIPITNANGPIVIDSANSTVDFFQLLDDGENFFVANSSLSGGPYILTTSLYPTNGNNTLGSLGGASWGTLYVENIQSQSTTTPLLFTGAFADGPTAIAFKFVSPAYTDAGAYIAQFWNNTAPVWGVSGLGDSILIGSAARHQIIGPDATAGTQTPDCLGLRLLGHYWTGAASQAAGFDIQVDITATTPAYRLLFSYEDTAAGELMALTKTGLLQFGGNTASFVGIKFGALDSGTTPGLRVRTATDSGDAGLQGGTVLGSSIVGLYASSTYKMLFYSAIDGFSIASNQFIFFDSTTNAAAASHDTGLGRDGAAGCLALRDGTTAQSFRVYGTWTSATNFERVALRYDGVTNNEYLLQTVKGSGGGTARPLTLGTDGGRALKIATDNSVHWIGAIANDTAGNEAATASAGAGGALPLTVEGYLIFTDSGGTPRKIPYYAT